MRAKRIVSAAAALMMLGCAVPGTALTAFADDGYEQKVDALGRRFARIMLDTNYSYTVDDPEINVSVPAQRKFDLRDVDGKNYVTPVKNQLFTGNCWAYTAAACMETSLLYKMGIDVNTCDESRILDFSERQLAWFVGVVLGEDTPYSSQAGEGSVRYASYLEMLKSDPNYQIIFKDFFSGGFNEYILSMLSTGQGPCAESLVPNLDDIYMTGAVVVYDVINDPAEVVDPEVDPFINEENTKEYTFCTKEEFLDIISDDSLMGQMINSPGSTDWYRGNGKYWVLVRDYMSASYFDWSVDDAYRFTGYTAENIIMTQRLADTDPDTGEYFMNENVLNTVKSELVNGRAVFISLNMYQGDQEDELRHMNYIDKNGEWTPYETKADCVCCYCFDDQYDPEDPESVNSTIQSDHAVTVVGYDDDFPKEYFNDPKGLIKGDGAFIVKNSWGSINSTYDYFGNNGDGYFYVSYYDQSLGKPMTIDMKVPDKEQKKLSVNFEHLYDVMPAPWYEACTYDDASYANVYHCDSDQKLISLGTLYSHPNNTVKYDVYILDDGFRSPTDGTLAASLTVRENYAGYHNTELEEPLYLKKGSAFSVVVTTECEDGSHEILFKNDANEKLGLMEYEAQKAAYIEEFGTEEGFVPDRILFSHGVINNGESFVYADGDWLDWSDVVDVMHTCGVPADNPNTNNADLTDFDNFSIHAYVENSYFSVDHRIAKPQDKPYNVGDEVECTVTLTKTLENETGTCEVFVNGKVIGSIDELALGESKELRYTYTVTEEDLKRGYFENTVQVFTQTAGGEYLEFDLMDPVNNTTLRADVAKPGDSSESKPESKAETETSSETDTSSEEKKVSTAAAANPNTGAAAGVTVIAAAAISTMIVSKRKSNR